MSGRHCGYNVVVEKPQRLQFNWYPQDWKSATFQHLNAKLNEQLVTTTNTTTTNNRPPHHGLCGSWDETGNRLKAWQNQTHVYVGVRLIFAVSKLAGVINTCANDTNVNNIQDAVTLAPCGNGSSGVNISTDVNTNNCELYTLYLVPLNDRGEVVWNYSYHFIYHKQLYKVDVESIEDHVVHLEMDIKQKLGLDRRDRVKLFTTDRYRLKSYCSLLSIACEVYGRVGSRDKPLLVSTSLSERLFKVPYTSFKLRHSSSYRQRLSFHTDHSDLVNSHVYQNDEDHDR